MAHFFVPSHGGDIAHGPAAADGAGISQISISPGGAAQFGIWGGGPDGSVLIAKVYRGSAVVNEGPAPVVKLARVSNDSARHIQVYTAYGLRSGDEIYGMLPDGRRWTSALTIKIQQGGANDVMAEWVQRRANAMPPPNRFLYPNAVPYLTLDDKAQGKISKLAEKNIGGPLNDVHGLSVHVTAGVATRSAYQMARWGCVETWNVKPFGVSAHFGISGDGTVVQFIPCNHMAWAQGNPGDKHWLSVEIDNSGQVMMTVNQMDSVKALFAWICTTFNIPRNLATGCSYPRAPQFDELTLRVCQSAGAQVTNDPFYAAMSRGLSCHWWLDSRKGAGAHACPGKGVLAQLPSLVRPGLVC